MFKVTKVVLGSKDTKVKLERAFKGPKAFKVLLGCRVLSGLKALLGLKALKDAREAKVTRACLGLKGTKGKDFKVLRAPKDFRALRGCKAAKELLGLMELTVPKAFKGQPGLKEFLVYKA